MNKILAIIVTYFPDIELLDENIKSFVEYVDEILIWENTPFDERVKHRLPAIAKVTYVDGGISNTGISKALNYAWHYAMANGYDYLLTMDQDSVWQNFEVFITNTIYKKETPKGLWGPHRNLDIRSTPIIEPTADLITSGMLVSIDILNKIGGWCEDFFVDGVDIDLCLHAIELNIPVLYINGCTLRQRFGEPEIKHLFGRSFSVSNRPAKRLYYIYRNLLFACRKYPKTKPYQKPFLQYRSSQVKFILLGEQHRVRKLLAIIAGTIVGYLKPIK